MRKGIFICITLIVTAGALGLVYANRISIREFVESVSRAPLPREESYALLTERNQFTPPTTEDAVSTSSTLLEKESETVVVKESDEISITVPVEKLLAVPFTSQAPHANWDLPYQEACEEASVLMVAGYYRGERGVIHPDDADRRLLELVAFQQEQYGAYLDTSATETARFALDFYGLQGDVVALEGPEQMKRFIAQGIPIIIPADGKTLPNPNFRGGGPLYHMLVVRGYTGDHFITNDPGTRKGESFLYTYDGLLNSVHDWNNGDVPNGKRVILLLRPSYDQE